MRPDPRHTRRSAARPRASEEGELLMSITGHAVGSSKHTKLEVRSPLDGELLATLPVHGAEDVQAAVARARRAAEVWGALSFRERRAHLLDYRRELVRRMDE